MLPHKATALFMLIVHLALSRPAFMVISDVIQHVIRAVLKHLPCFRLALCAVRKNVPFQNMPQIGIAQ